MRKTRSCKELNALPQIGEGIEVFWHIHDNNGKGPQEVWWGATVDSLETSDRRDSVATGVITYHELDDFEAERMQVTYLPGRKLRASNGQSTSDTTRSRTGRDRNTYKNRKFPELVWRRSITNDVSTDRESSTTMTTRSERAQLRVTTQNPIGRDNFVSTGRSTVGTSTMTRVMYEDMRRLRRSHASLVDDIGQLNARLAIVEKKIPDRDPESPHLFRFMQRKLAHVLESHSMNPLKNGNHKTRKLVDGVRTGVIRVKTDCNIEQFEGVARHIHLRSREYAKQVLFDPLFHHTQSPSTSTMQLNIMFSNATALFQAMGIESIDDRLNFIRRWAKTKQGDAIRLLGTYSYDLANDKSPSLINVGGSLPSLDHDDHRRVPNTTTIPVLKRDSREWDMVDGMYMYPITLINEEVADAKNCVNNIAECFSLTWKRYGTNLKRKWSQGIRTTAYSLGTLELNVPYVVITDIGTLEDTKELISDRTLQHFLSQCEPRDIDK